MLQKMVIFQIIFAKNQMIMRVNIEEQASRQFTLCIRSFMLRMQILNKNSSQDLEKVFAKLLANNQIKQSVINHLINTEIKGDSNQIVMLTLLEDLTKWSAEYYEYLLSHPGPMESILHQSISLLNIQQQYYTVVPKQNELISALLMMPYCLQKIEEYKYFYKRIKTVKDFYSSNIKEAQKQVFVKAVSDSIVTAVQYKNIQILDFITSDIVQQLQGLELSHEIFPSRLRIIKKIVKNLWAFHEPILIKAAYIIIQISKTVLDNPHALSFVFGLYEQLLEKFMESSSMVPLIMFTHLIMNNLTILQRKGGEFLKLQIVLGHIQTIFKDKYLNYFLKLYDWNFMEEDICHQCLKILYQYIEDTGNEKKPEIQIYKRKLSKIHERIRQFLQKFQLSQDERKKGREEQHIYNLKKKQCRDLVEEMNNKPKNIFKKISSFENEENKEYQIQKYVRILKKSKNINYKSMIDIVSTNNEISTRILQQYALSFIKRSKNSSLQEFMRLFIANFFLTGQSQQISRVLDEITKFYFSQRDPQKEFLKKSDDVYYLAYAIIMLNTSLHNPKNEEKTTEQTFLSQCKGLNLPNEAVKNIYKNIKENEIHTFRNRFQMHNISLANWELVATDYQSLTLSYYDEDMEEVSDKCFYLYADDLLSSIIDEKQTAKLESMIEKFEYQEKKFQCDIIEISRKMVNSKSHIPMHVLQKIFQVANFKASPLNDRLLSYFWLAANVIENFKQNLPISKICQFLIKTWSIRHKLRDNLFLREIAELKKIKKNLKDNERKQSKRSFVGMISSFFQAKDSEDEEEIHQTLPIFTKKINHSNITQSIFQIILSSEDLRMRAAENIILYIRNEESKIFQEFLSCLFLIFNLVKNSNPEELLKVCENFFQQILLIKETELSKRIQSLKTKDEKRYGIMEMYLSYWILKLIINCEGKGAKILEKVSQSVEKFNKQILVEVVQIGKNKTLPESLKKLLIQEIEKNGMEKNKEVQEFYAKNCQKKVQSKQEKKERSQEKQKPQQSKQVVKEMKKQQENAKQSKQENKEKQEQQEKKDKQNEQNSIQKIIEKELESLETEIAKKENQPQKEEIEEKQEIKDEIEIDAKEEIKEDSNKEEKEETEDPQVSLPIYML